MVMSGPTRPRIDVSDALDAELFAQARVPELEFLNAAVAAVSSVTPSDDGSLKRLPGSAAGGLHDQAEALPRHLRRRTTSHKPRRMPTALKNRNHTRPREPRNSCATSSEETSAGRQASRTFSREASGPLPGLNEESQADRRRCRKHRRRPRALLEAHNPHGEEGWIEGSRARWLETHIWHAKRMHMKEMWGFVLPMTSNRGQRAVAEAALKNSTVQDVTFLRPLEMRGPLGRLQEVLRAVTDPLDGRPLAQECLDGLVEASTHLYRLHEFPLGCIAPITVMWSPCNAGVGDESHMAMSDHRSPHERGGAEEGQETEIRQLWLWVHAAAAKEALRELRKTCELDGAPCSGAVQIEPVIGGLCRLRVRGARAHDVIRSVVQTRADAVSAARGAVAGLDSQSPPPSGASDAKAKLDTTVTAVGGTTASSLKGPSGGEGLARQHPSRLPAGSVLSLMALDPRERPSRPAAPMTAASPRDDSAASAAAATGREGGISLGNAAGVDSTVSRTTVAAADCQPPDPASRSFFSLWHREARALSTMLAEARRDHVLNEARRRQRARAAWGNEKPVISAQAWSPQSLAGNRNPGSSDHEEGTPVILVSASGVATAAHRLDGASGNGDSRRVSDWARLCYGGGRGRSRDRKTENRTRSMAAGWDVITSAGWGAVFFHAIVMAGGRAISVRDADILALETGEPCFPADYPDTKSGHSHWDGVGREAASAWLRTRPKHRGSKTPPHAAPIHPSREKDRAQREEVQQNALAAPAAEIASPSLFRPDFGRLAGAAGPPPEVERSECPAGGDKTAGGAVLEPNSDGHGAAELIMPSEQTFGGDGSGGREEASVAKEEENSNDAGHTVILGEPFAVARGFYYIQAFLAGCGSADAGVVGLEDLPPPLQLAMPTLLEVTLTQSKGVAAAGASIYPAWPEHHQQWLRGQAVGKPWPGFGAERAVYHPPQLEHAIAAPVAADEVRGIDDEANAQQPQQRQRWQLPRQAIGAVTSGGFSSVRGGGTGRGVCEAAAMRDALFTTMVLSTGQGQVDAELEDQGTRRPWPLALVLVGNNAGSWYRPAVAEVVS